MSPISPSTRISGLMALRASTASFVCRTFCTNGSADRSKTTESKPALATSRACASEWVWSALRKIGWSYCSLKLRTRAAICRTPKNSRSPSEAPTATGTLRSRAAATTAFNSTRSATLKWPIAIPSFSLRSRAFRKVCMLGSSWESRYLAPRVPDGDQVYNAFVTPGRQAAPSLSMATRAPLSRLPRSRAPDPLVLVDRLDPQFPRLGEFRAGAGSGDDKIGLGRDRARDLGPQPLGDRLGLVAGHLFQRAREDDGLPGERVAGGDRLHRLDCHFLDERVERHLVARLGEEIGDRHGDHGPYSPDRRNLLGGVFGPGGGAQGFPVAEMAREAPRIRLPDMANAKCVEEPVERDRPARVDGVEQVARRSLAEPLPLAQRRAALSIARIQSEDMIRRADQTFGEKKFDQFFA